MLYQIQTIDKIYGRIITRMVTKKRYKMTYEVTLIDSDIRDAMDGEFRLGLIYDGEQKAELEYRWDATQFTAVFHGHAPSLPIPAHPTTLIQKPIAAMLALKTKNHNFLTDVFKDHCVTIDLTN